MQLNNNLLLNGIINEEEFMTYEYGYVSYILPLTNPINYNQGQVKDIIWD